MSIELHVRLAKPGITKGQVLSALQSRLGKTRALGVTLSWSNSLPEDLLDDDTPPLDLSYGDDLLVRATLYVVKLPESSSPAPDEQAGLWVSVGVVTRAEESPFLMFLAAAAFAEAGNSVVIDEVELLESGRIIKPSTIDEALASSIGRDLAESSARFSLSLPKISIS